MASRSEATFGQRYEKGNQMLVLIQGLTDYLPTNTDITPISFKNFLTDLNLLNNTTAQNQDTLSQVRDLRNNSYHGPNGLKELGGMIRDYIGSLQGGKNTNTYKNIKKEVNKLKGYKKPKTKMVDNVEVKTLSQSEQSFGSLIQSGKNILAIIQGIQGYAPSNTNITVQGFQAILNNIEILNNSVQEKNILVANNIANRKEMYEGENGLRVRLQMIKNYIAGTYGKNSQEYKNAMTIKY